MSIAKACKLGGIICFLSIVILVACNITVIKGTRDLQAFAEQRFNSILLAQEVRSTSAALTANARDYVSSGNPVYEKTYWDLVNKTSGDMPRPVDAPVAPGQTISMDDLLIASGFTREELALLQESNELSMALVLLEEQAMNAVKGLYPDASGAYTVKGEPDLELAHGLMFGAEYDAAVEKIMVPSFKFDKMVTDRMNTQDQKVRYSLKLATIALSISVAVISLVMLAGVILMLGKIVRPIRETAAFALSVAEGNLDTVVPGMGRSNDNEITSMVSSMGLMVKNLKAKIQDAQQKSQEAEEQQHLALEAGQKAREAQSKAEAGRAAILAAAEEVESVVDRLSAATEQLAAQVEEASRSADHQQGMVTSAVGAVAEINDVVRVVAESAQRASESSVQSQGRAEEGAAIVRESSKSLDNASSEAARLNELMESLGEQAHAIDSVITVINDIADQTNLLALNAAIEAARAGEAGRGFAVVADSVRQLAEKTMVATKEVNTTVKGIQQGTRQSLEATEKTTGDVGKAAELAQESGQALTGIVAGTQDTAGQIHNITQAAERQSESCTDLTNSLNQINSIATETARTMSDSAKAVSELSGQIRQLQGLVHQLRSH